MPDFRVPTVQLSTVIHYRDGSVLQGTVFTPAQSAVQSGPMLPLEWVNSPTDFFPFRPDEAGAAILLNKHWVVAFSVENRPELQDPSWDSGTARCRVALEAGSVQFEGEVVIDLPENRRRLIDFLNQAQTFLCLTSGERQILIRKDRISKVTELRET
jgi:hypothetical protein